MSLSSVCRVCLCRAGAGMCSVTDRQLVAVYEKLTDAKLLVSDGRPGALCYMCLAQLRCCRVFADTALRTDRLLRQLTCTNSKVAPETVAGLLAAGAGVRPLSINTLTPVSFDGSSPGATNEMTIKEEATEVFTKQEEGIHFEDEHREIKKESAELYYNCDDCGLKLATKRLLVGHLRVHNKNTYCKECHKQFASVNSLRAHASVHSGARPHACRSCGRTFRQKPYLQSHMRMHQRKPHFCNDCNIGFTHADALKKHTFLHTKHKPFGCDRCNKTFMYKSALNRHVQIHTGVKPFGCSACSKTFSTRGGLSKHARTHSGSKPYRCESCDAAFGYVGNLRRHAHTHDESKTRSETCNEKLSDGSDLKMLHRAGEKTFACSVCDKKFIFKSTLNKHMQTHETQIATDAKTRNRPICTVCNLTVASNSHLILHMRTHSGEKPFSCDVCNKTFKSKSTLKGHMRTHTGEKVCSCEICGMSFTQTGSLGRHMVLHSESLPYACRLCDKAYKQSGQLAAHVRNVHDGVKRFSCGECGARFTASSHLKRHMDAHRGIKPYSCFKCHYKFGTRSILNRHMRNTCK